MAKNNVTTAGKLDDATKADATEVANTSSDMLAAFAKEGGQKVNFDVSYHRFTDETGQKRYPIRGILLDRRERREVREDGKKSYYYILGVTAPCHLVDREGKAVEADKGDYAWIDERWCLQTLKGYLPKTRIDSNGITSFVGLHEVLIVPKDKKPLGGGHTLWTAEVLARPVQPTADMPLIAPQSNEPPPPAQLTAGGSTDDIPF